MVSETEKKEEVAYTDERRVYEYITIQDEKGIAKLKVKKSFICDSNITYPSKIVEIMNNYFDMNLLCEEYAYIICLDIKGWIKGIFEIAKGGIAETHVDIKTIFQKCFLTNSTDIIIVHNHPSGDHYPSRADRLMTKKINDASGLLGINFRDSIIIGSEYLYYSFREMDTEGILNNK